jgi:hypothetical protein
MDAYITAAEADYIIAQCHCNDDLSQQWQAMTENEKASCLRNATYRIDCLSFTGHKHSPAQALQFPRGMSADVPYKVKLATAEEALSAIDTALLKRITMQQQGITAIKLGNASETYDTAKKPDTGPLLSAMAYNYLRQYISGSAVIV